MIAPAPLLFMPEPDAGNAGADARVALGATATLYRNLSCLPFSDPEAVRAAAKHFPDFRRFRDAAHEAEEGRRRGLLLYISPGQREHGGFSIPVSGVAVNIGLDNHLAFRAAMRGAQPVAAWQKTAAVENALANHWTYAFTLKFGFLTRDLSDAGTGLRMSTHLHLPGIFLLEEQEAVARAADVFGLTLHHLSPDGRIPLVALSHTLALGRTEERMGKDLQRVTDELIARELDARAYFEKHPLRMKDKIQRAAACLQAAQLIEPLDAAEQLAWFRWGVLRGDFPSVTLDETDHALSLLPCGNGAEIGPQRLTESEQAAQANTLRTLLQKH